MRYKVKRFSWEEDTTKKLLEEAKKKGINPHVAGEFMPKDATAYYVPKKGIGGRAVKILKKRIESHPEAIDEKTKKTLNDINPGDIHLRSLKGDPFIVGHEIGHGVNERSFLRHLPDSGYTTAGIGIGSFVGGYKKGKAKDKKEEKKGTIIGKASIIAGQLQTPIDEHLASQYSLKQLKKLGASKEYLKTAKISAYGNTLAYLNPLDIATSPTIRKKVIAPAAINGGLYAAGKYLGKRKKSKEEKSKKD